MPGNDEPSAWRTTDGDHGFPRGVVGGHTQTRCELVGADLVADTPLGRLACIASEEVLYPEIARAPALRGAEGFLHSTSDVGSPRPTPEDEAKRARAYENRAWVVSANSAGIGNLDFPAASTGGMSQIPANTMLGADGRPVVPEGTHFVATQRRAIAALQARWAGAGGVR